MLRHVFKLFLFIIWLCSGQVLFAKANNIIFTEAKKEQQSVIFSYTGKKPEYKISRIAPFDKKPARYIIDIANAEISKDLKDKVSDTPFNIRIAQFEQNITRIVLESYSLSAFSKINIDNTKANKLIINWTSDNSNNKYINFIQPDDETLLINIKALKASKIHYRVSELTSPSRLVIDLLNWESTTEQLKIIQTTLPDLIKEVRMGYPLTTEPKTIRLVVELSSSTKYKFTDKLIDDKNLNITVSFNQDNSKKFTVLLDAGHGGYDVGALYKNTFEKDIVLSITKELKQILLKQKNIKVHMIRDTDEFVTLDDRVEITKRLNPNLFISIHCNALENNTEINGLETYYYKEVSKPLAQIIHKQLVQDLNVNDRNVRSARFVVIRETDIPSVLVETGYMSNPSELSKLKNASYQSQIAESIAKALIKYLEP